MVKMIDGAYHTRSLLLSTTVIGTRQHKLDTGTCWLQLCGSNVPHHHNPHQETPSLNFQCPFKFFLLLLLLFFWNSRTHFEDMIVFDGPHLPRERWWQPEFLSFFQVTVILLCPSLSSFRTFWPLKTCTLALTVLHVARILSGSEWCAWTQNHLP
jgi:hypothetical protein